MTEVAMSMGREASQSYWIQSSCLTEFSFDISTGFDRFLLCGFSKRDPRKDLTEPTKISMAVELGGVLSTILHSSVFFFSRSSQLTFCRWLFDVVALSGQLCWGRGAHPRVDVPCVISEWAVPGCVYSPPPPSILTGSVHPLPNTPPPSATRHSPFFCRLAEHRESGHFPKKFSSGMILTRRVGPN